MTTYNGWSNWETWLINLEVIDYDYWEERYEEGGIATLDDIADMLRSEHQEYLDEIEKSLDTCSMGSIAKSFVQQGFSQVNWGEIARHVVEAIKETDFYKEERLREEEEEEDDDTV